MRTRVLTVMFADLAGFTARTTSQSHEQNAAMLRRLADVIHPFVSAAGGRVVKELGDGVLCIFGSPTRAAEAAMAIQDRLAELNAGKTPAETLELRIALSVGEVRLERGDVFGEAVNLGARIEAQTPPGAVYLSASAVQTMNRVGLPLSPVGARALKGIGEPVAIWRLAHEPEHGLPFGGRQLSRLRAVRRRKRLGVAAASIAAAALAAAAGIWIGTELTERNLRAELARAVSAGHSRQAADLLSALGARGASVDAEIDLVLEGLGRAADAGGACVVLDQLNPRIASTARRQAAARLRLQHIISFLEAGELAQAEVCLAAVQVENDAALARLAELSAIHLDALESLRSHSWAELRRVLGRYEAHLRAGGAPAAHLALASRIAAAAFDHKVTRPIADSLVAEFLAPQAVAPMMTRLFDAGTDPGARAWLLARLEGSASEAPIDWLALYAAQLDSGHCGLERSAIAGLRRTERLSAVGLLLREAETRERCTREAALSAARELVATGKADLTPPLRPVIVASR